MNDHSANWRTMPIHELFQGTFTPTRGLDRAAVEVVTIGGTGFFAGCKIYIDSTLPPDTVEIWGKNRVRMNLTTGEITAFPATADRSAQPA